MPVISSTDLKTHLGVTTAQFDTVIDNAVNAVNQSVVQHCGRDFDKVAQGAETARVFYPRDRCVAVIDDFWDVLNLVVKTDEGDDGTYETTWTATADYQLEPLNQRESGITVPYYRLRAVGSRRFPCNRRPSLQVTAAWGWTAVPAAVKEATLLWGARTFHRKDSPQGVAGFNEFGAVRLTSTDGDIVNPLKPFRRIENLLLVG